MSTVRSIERRLYVRRQADRDMASQAAVVSGEAPRHMEWNGVWSGYLAFVGFAVLLLSFVWGIGFASLNPVRGSSWADVGGGTLAWSVVMILIATVIGAWVAGRTPRTSRQHGMMRGVVLWGMILATMLLVMGWTAGTAVSAAANFAGPAAGAVGANHAAAVQSTLAANGVNITNAQATAIANQLMAGDRTGAAGTLAADANLTTTRADTLLSQVPAPAAGAAGTAANAVQQGGGRAAWGLFWIALIGLGCALVGGAAGGGGLQRRALRPTSQPA
jgi:hypothetical protein